MSRKVYAADFEATTDPLDCRVWLWGLADVTTPDRVQHGTSIRTFISTVAFKDAIIYFHNLKYDGHFIIDWLLRNGFDYLKDGRNDALYKGSFKTLISDMNKFYSISVCWPTGRRTEFRDSYKKLPMNLANVAKSFDMEIAKGSIDYEAYRPVGHKPTKEELEYLNTDVIILASAIGQVHENGMEKLTLPSDALKEYKSLVGSKMFVRAFPILPDETDADIRRSYKGGFTYADPRYVGRHIETPGIVFDVNSLYPYVMRYMKIPYGEPIFEHGYVETDEIHPLSIFTVTITAKLKQDHIPCIQIKGSFRFSGTEYLRKIEEPTTITVTSVDWALYNDHYNIEVLEYHGGWLFKATEGLFDSFIDKWTEIKANSTGGKRAIAKLNLNALYGKFATNPNVTAKHPVLEDNRVKFVRGADETRPPVYTAAGAFITAYARDITIRAAQRNYDRFAYADTDSLHLMGTDIPADLEIHPTKLGAWKFEYKFAEAYYVRPKVYLEMMDDGTFHNAFAGLPEAISSTLTFSDMVDGKVFKDKKLVPKSVPGGVVLTPVDFTLNLS